MATLTLQQELREKLQNASDDVLRQVIGYVDGVLENKMYQQNVNYQLTEEQKRKLDEMEKNLTDEDFRPVDNFIAEMREKYGIQD